MILRFLTAVIQAQSQTKEVIKMQRTQKTLVGTGGAGSGVAGAKAAVAGVAGAKATGAGAAGAAGAKAAFTNTKANTTAWALVAGILCLLLALSVGALAGCSGGGGGGAVSPDKNFQGTWKLSGMAEGDQVYSEEDVKLIEKMGGTCSMTFNEDKTFAFEYFGENESGTWEAKDANTCSITVSGQNFEAKLNNGKLVTETDGASMTFTKQS